MHPAMHPAPCTLALNSYILEYTKSNVRGKGFRGQLGHKDVQEEYSPRIVTLLRRKGASKIVCGDDHTLVKCFNGHVFVFGANHKGQVQGLGCRV